MKHTEISYWTLTVEKKKESALRNMMLNAVVNSA